MFSFLNTTVLFAAVTALIPLIIHLFSRRKVKVIEFSSLKHLKAMQRRQVRRLRIRQLLLLIIRTLIILLIVLAFARPTIESGGVGSHAAVSAVILFDNSASMNRDATDGNLFEIARERTRELIETFGEADQVAFVPLAVSKGTDQFPAFGSAALALEQLKRLNCGSFAADLESAFDRTIGLLSAASNLNKEIYIVTDRQRQSLPDTALLSGAEANIYFVELPIDEIENCGITTVDFGGQLIIPGHDFQITATIKNYSVVDRDDIIASLYLDGNRVAQSDFSIAAGNETTVGFTRAVSASGFHSGRIELSDDMFAADNRYYFSFSIPEQFNLLVIDGDQTGALMSLALTPSKSINQYWSVKTTTPDALAGINFLDYDVIILAGTPRLSDIYAGRLKAYVHQGRSLLLTYGGKTDIEDFNSTWSTLTGVHYEKPARSDFTRAGYYSFLSIDIDHPIFSVFELEDNRPPEIKFYSLPTLTTTNGARTLLRFTGDRPALVEADYGEGKVLMFTGPMAPHYTDLTGHAFFVPFVSRAAEYLASNLSSFDLRLFCGDNISRSLALKTTVGTSLDLLTPDSGSYSLAPLEEKGALVLRVKPTDMPGQYHISYFGREIDRFALNVDRAECDLNPADGDQFAAAIGAEDPVQLGLLDDLAETLAESRFGKELWQLFLWLAAAFIVAEILLARGADQKEE